MTSRATKTLLEGLNNRLALRMSDMESRDCLDLLQTLRDEILREENLDTGTSKEIETLRDRLGNARLVDELIQIRSRMIELTSEHFRSRSSVGMFQEYTCKFLETLLCSAIILAEDQLRLEGNTGRQSSWSLLASGILGRQEATKERQLVLLLIYRGSEPEDREYYRNLALRIMAIFNECSIPMQRSFHGNGNLFWHGSMEDWRQLLAGSLNSREADTKDPSIQPYKAGQDELYARSIEIMADMRTVCGDVDLAMETMQATREILDAELHGDRFRHYARRTATMPVALGIFGRFRTARTGKHRGEFSLEELAITPLVGSVRVMAISAGIRETATTDRIRSLMVSGNIGVTLADRLLLAMHNFIRCQIEMDISSQVNGDEHFFNPNLLDENAKDRFKAGLEDLTTLQRLLYQQIVEVD